MSDRILPAVVLSSNEPLPLSRTHTNGFAPHGADLLSAPHGADLLRAPHGADLLRAPHGATPETHGSGRDDISV